MINDYTKSPRIYLTNPLAEGGEIPLGSDHSHYLLTVLRKQDGDAVRVFNGKNGEFVGSIRQESKKQASLTDLKMIKPQPEHKKEIHLYFAPIKKERLSFLIEKAVELGVTDFHPILTAHTENRKPNFEKIQAHIVEAAEQCERLDMPVLHPAGNMVNCHFFDPTFVAMERSEHRLFSTSLPSLGIFIGPEGGWSQDERHFMLNHEALRPVSLGELVLRAETAALFMLARIAQ